MKKLILVALAAILMIMPAATVMAQHGGGGHGGGGGSHGGGSHGGSSGGGSHGGGSWHGGHSTSSYHGGGSGHGHGGSWHGGHGGHGGYYPYYPYWGYGYGWGWGFGPWGFYGYYGPYGDGYGYVGGSRYNGSNSDWTVVDTDVSPEEARVFLDGRYIGLADDFDGHPDYLYLRSGTYSLEFRLEGYESQTVSVVAKSGSKVNLNNKLKKIPGAKQYGSYDTPQPEGGLQRYFGKKPDGTDEALDRSRNDEDRFYRDGEQDRGDIEATPDDDRRPSSQPPPRGGSDLREDEWRQSAPRHGARLLLMIQPADAAVYLDDRFIGTAEEVAGPDQAVPLSAGKHTVTVSRPGYKDKTVEVEILAGEVKRVDVKLEK